MTAHAGPRRSYRVTGHRSRCGAGRLGARLDLADPGPGARTVRLAGDAADARTRRRGADARRGPARSRPAIDLRCDDPVGAAVRRRADGRRIHAHRGGRSRRRRPFRGDRCRRRGSRRPRRRPRRRHRPAPSRGDRRGASRAHVALRRLRHLGRGTCRRIVVPRRRLGDGRSDPDRRARRPVARLRSPSRRQSRCRNAVAEHRHR